MDKIKKADFEKWINKQGWFKINEVDNPNGHQDNYLTPAGEFIYCLYSMEGELQQVIKPMAAPVPTQGKSLGRFPIDFRGGQPFPTLGGPPG